MSPIHLSIDTAQANPAALLADLMAKHPCYAFVANAERTGARALFRGRWRWEDVQAYLTSPATTIVMNDERASGYLSFRLYSMADGYPDCLAEIEVYFARGDGRTVFWCETRESDGALSLAA